MSEVTEQIAGDELATDLPDVSGIPSAQLKQVFAEHLDTDPTFVAEKIGIDYQYLHKLVIDPIYPVIKLGMADRILSALDLSVSALVMHGDLTVVPLRKSRSAAMRLVDEEIEFAQDLGYGPPTTEMIEARISELLTEYEENCPLTEAAAKRRETDRLRKQAQREAA